MIIELEIEAHMRKYFMSKSKSKTDYGYAWTWKSLFSLKFKTLIVKMNMLFWNRPIECCLCILRGASYLSFGLVLSAQATL